MNTNPGKGFALPNLIRKKEKEKRNPKTFCRRKRRRGRYRRQTEQTPLFRLKTIVGMNLHFRVPEGLVPPPPSQAPLPLSHALLPKPQSAMEQGWNKGRRGRRRRRGPARRGLFRSIQCEKCFLGGIIVIRGVYDASKRPVGGLSSSLRRRAFSGCPLHFLDVLRVFGKEKGGKPFTSVCA